MDVLKQNCLSNCLNTDGDLLIASLRRDQKLICMAYSHAEECVRAHMRKDHALTVSEMFLVSVYVQIHSKNRFIPNDFHGKS